jgi:hypothetical protein
MSFNETPNKILKGNRICLRAGVEWKWGRKEQGRAEEDEGGSVSCNRSQEVN